MHARSPSHQSWVLVLILGRSLELFFRELAVRVPDGKLLERNKSNSFQVISDLLNSDNLKVAITQLCHELQV